MRKGAAIAGTTVVIIAVLLWRFAPFGQRRDGSILRLYGNVDIREVQLAFRITDRVRGMYAEEGNAVTRGQLLAELHGERFTAQVEQARAALQAEQALLERALAGSRPEEIRAARAEVNRLEAELKAAELEYGRMQKLARTDFASRQRLDAAEALYRGTLARLDAAREQLALAEQGPRREDIALQRARTAAAEAALRRAEEDLRDVRLLAPAEGMIRERVLEPGDIASPEKPAYTVSSLNPLWVRAYIPETELGKVALGMPATVYSDSFPGKGYAGWVGFISPTAEFTPKQVETVELRSKLVYQTRIIVCNPENELRLGMPATVDIALAAGLQGQRTCVGQPQ